MWKMLEKTDEASMGYRDALLQSHSSEGAVKLPLKGMHR